MSDIDDNNHNNNNHNMTTTSNTEDQPEIFCPTSRNFDCQVESAFTCKQCGKVDSVKEMFRDFSLDILSAEDLANWGMDPETDPPTISDLLDLYFRDDNLEMKCEKCGNATAWLHKKIVKLPRVLVLHIKRFLPDPITFTYEKKRDKILPAPVVYLDTCSAPDVQLPIPLKKSTSQNGNGRSPKRRKMDDTNDDESELIMDNSTTRSSRKYLYRLHSIVAHKGSSATFGHYVAYVKDEGKPIWKLFDDSMVIPIEQERVLSPEKSRDGYIYFYKYSEEDNMPLEAVN